jgi:hypothetical protein
LCTPNARGGFSPKIHLRTNAKGDPLIFDVTSGEAHEVKGYDALMRLHEADPSKLLGDKGYDSDDIRRDLIDRGIEPIIPPTNDATSSSDARITSIAGPNPRNGTSLEYPTFYRTAQIDGLSIQRGRPKRRADRSLEDVRAMQLADRKSDAYWLFSKLSSATASRKASLAA